MRRLLGIMLIIHQIIHNFQYRISITYLPVFHPYSPSYPRVIHELSTIFFHRYSVVFLLVIHKKTRVCDMHTRVQDYALSEAQTMFRR